MLDERKAAILRVVVEKYIETAQPVGSGHVASAPGVGVSPATVRSEMASLEHEGYLVQPHTSAGRIPTDKGYRFFVDSLGRGTLDPSAVQQVRSFFASAHGAIEQMLHDTSQLLAKLTNYAAVVVPPAIEAASIRSVQVVALGRRNLLVVAVLSNGVVESTPFEVDHDVADEHVASANSLLGSLLVGRNPARLAEIVPPDTGDADRDTLVRAALGALAAEANDEDQLFVGGAARMAAAFDAVDTVRTVLSTLEHQYVVVSLLNDLLERGLSVAIGSEHGVEPLAACSVVVAPYLVEGKPVGTIGVLGPTRMNYPQALAAVEIVSERLGRRLTT